MTKKKIIWHLPYAIVGGVETSYATILKYIDTEKYQHIVTCNHAISSWCKANFPRHVSVWGYSDELSLGTHLQSINPNLIFGTHGGVLYQALAAKDIQCPVVEIVHGSHIWAEHNVFMPKGWTKEIVAVSNSALKVYEQHSDNKLQNSVIINGVDTEVFYPQAPFATSPKIFGYTGRFLECDKHIKKLIKGFKSIGDFRTRLHLVGGTNQEIITLKHFTRGLGIEGLVKFFPHTNRPEAHLKSMHIFTVRSEAEGYCNSVAEALACGIPSVCYNFGGILDHVPHGTILVGENQVEYAQALREIYKNKSLRLEMRNKGLQFIQKEGNAKLTASRYEQVIDRNCTAPVFIPAPTNFVTKKIHFSDDTVQVNKTVTNPTVGVCNIHWHGIAAATRSISDEVVSWHRDPQMIVNNILRHKPGRVVFSGMCPGFDVAIRKLRKSQPELPIFVYYHGGVSHYSFKGGLFGQGEQLAFQSIIDLHKEGYIDRIAVSSPGLESYLSSISCVAKFCGNKFEAKDSPKSTPREGIHIGSWNRPHDHKHTSMGYALATMMGGTLHCVNGTPKIPGATNQVINYGELPKNVLFKMYQEMSVNLQLSFIETFNISVLEMWACGGIAVVGPGNYVLVKDNDFLLKNCFILDHTNPEVLYYKVKNLLKLDREEVLGTQKEHLDKLNKQSTERWEKFLHE